MESIHSAAARGCLVQRRTSFPTQRRRQVPRHPCNRTRSRRAVPGSAMRRRAPAMGWFAVNCEENPSWNPKLAMRVDSVRVRVGFRVRPKSPSLEHEIAGIDAIREGEMDWRRHNRHYRWLGPEQTLITSTCGFNHLSWHIALAKLRTMTAAKAIPCGKLRCHS